MLCYLLCLTFAELVLARREIKKQENRHGKTWPDITAVRWASSASGLAGAAEKEGLLLLRIDAAAGLDCCWIHGLGWLRLYSCGLRMCDDSLLPRRLWPADQEGVSAGKEGPALQFLINFLSSLLAAAQVEACLELAGRTRCCGWFSLDLLAILRMLCSVAVSGVMLPTVPGLRRRGRNKKQKQSSMQIFINPASPLVHWFQQWSLQCWDH